MVLDIDGTLMDTTYLHVAAWARAFPEVGVRAPTVDEVWFATSAKPDELENHQEQLEYEGTISGIVNSSDVENSKPVPDTFELILKRAGASPEETVAVGDKIWDVKAAKAAGIRTVSVLTGGAFSEEELRDAGAVEVYKGREALLDSNFPE